MKKLIWVAAGVLLFTSSSFAQSAPRVDLSAGYSYLRGGGVNENGGSISLAGYFNDWIGVVGDVGYYHGSPAGASINTETYMFGPRISTGRNGKIAPFAQVLFGAAHVAAGFGGFTASGNAFAYSVGGGIDYGILPHVALRPQIDYIGMRSGGVTLNNGRFSVSIVFRLGK